MDCQCSKRDGKLQDCGWRGIGVEGGPLGQTLAGRIGVGAVQSDVRNGTHDIHQAGDYIPSLLVEQREEPHCQWNRGENPKLWYDLTTAII